MELFYLTTAVFACIAVDSSLALQCYQCSSGVPGQPPVPNCVDPFNAEGIETVDCAGRCSAIVQSSTTAQGTVEITERSCKVAEELQECPPQPTCATNEQGRSCSYCCDTDMCNSEVATTSGGIECYTCNAETTESAPAPGSCASDDFNGEGAIAASCQGKCVSAKLPANAFGDGAAAQVIRSCDDEAGICQMQQIPEGATRKCCDSNLCNVGSDIPDAEPEPNDGDDGGDVTTDDDDDNDDDKEGTIQCWQCDTKVANGTDEQTVCYTGMFPADDIKKIDCPSGKCLSYEYPADDGAGKMFSRGCLTPQMEQLGLCNGNSNATCCTSNLCNKGNSASAITASVATIISAVFVVACLAFK